MKKMQKGGGGARAKKIPGMGTYRKKSPSKPKGMGMGPGKKPKSKLFGLKGENPFGKKKFQPGGGTPFQNYLKTFKYASPSDTVPSGMPGSTMDEKLNGFTYYTGALDKATKQTYGDRDPNTITNAAEEKKARENNYRLTRKTGGAMYQKGGSQKMSKTIKKLGSKAKKAMKKIMPAIDKRMGETTQIQRLKQYKQMGGGSDGKSKSHIKDFMQTSSGKPKNNKPGKGAILRPKIKPDKPGAPKIKLGTGAPKKAPKLFY